MLWGDKPYYSFDYYLKEKFGEKIYKIALDGGMTCPNRDGTLDTRGCIFCSAGGSGDFATRKMSSISQQVDCAIKNLQAHDKKTGNKYIAYFQSYTNTYAPVNYLRSLYMEAIKLPQIVGIAIGTRPDCFNDEIFALIEECNKIKPVWIELGLQTIHEQTAQFIRRGYTLSTFENTVHRLRKLDIDVIIHIILGLPEETTDDIIETIHYLNHMDIQGIKLQLLHVLKGTDLAKYLPRLKIYTEDEYITLLVRCIGELSPNIVIHRLTGDGPKNLLLAPNWSTNKRHVLNKLAHTLKVENVYQGKYFLERGV